MKKSLLIIKGLNLYIIGIKIENKRKKLKKLLLNGSINNYNKIIKITNKIEKLKYKFDVNESDFLKIKYK